MNVMDSVRDLLKQLVDGAKTMEEVEAALKSQYIANLDGMAQLDVFRHKRTGIPEVVFAETKPTGVVLEIADRMLNANHFVILTRCKPEDLTQLKLKFGSNSEYQTEINERARVAFITDRQYQAPSRPGHVGIITAGTSDIFVAEEARVTLHAMGIKTSTTYDVGIAGMHRLFPPLQKMIQDQVDVLIVVAGMEGTLPGVVTALVDIPVIGVPVSAGYGLGEKGIGALTTMLQSCSPGLSVVNIDNGFGAAAIAAIIIRNMYKKKC
jgi:NCAIR mutase (PurE)-related protein